MWIDKVADEDFLSDSLKKLLTSEYEEDELKNCFDDVLDESSSECNMTFETRPKLRRRPGQSKTTTLIVKNIEKKEKEFSKMNHFCRATILLRFLMPEAALKNILNEEYIINIGYLKIWDHESLSDTFMDEFVQSNVKEILGKYMTKEAFEFLEKMIFEKEKFTCKICLEEASDKTVGCETCLRWFHFKCVGYNPEGKKKEREEPWFCEDCHLLFA